MHRTILYGLLIAFVTFNSGCLPKKVDTKHGYYLVNKYCPVSLRVYLYSTLADYNSKSNLYYACTLPARGNIQLEPSQIDNTKTYYYDAYSEDFEYSNWSETSVAISGALAGAGDSLNIGCNHQPFRKIFMHGNDMVTTWMAVNRYDVWHVSDWASLSSAQRVKVLTLNWDKTGMVTGTDFNSNVTTDTITGMTQMFTGDSLKGLSLATRARTYMVFNTPVPPLNPTNYHTSQDTLLLEDNQGDWVMVRQ